MSEEEIASSNFGGSGRGSDTVAAMTERWFAHDALALLDARNRREVDCFTDLIEAHQQLLYRAASNSLGASMQNMSSSMRLTPTDASANDVHTQLDAVAHKYLATIQQLERDVSAKNAELAAYAGNQLALVRESKELVQAQDQWTQQLAFFTKRLEEEMLLNEEKDRSIHELDAALQLVRDELARHRVLLAKADATVEALTAHVAALEHQLARGSPSQPDTRSMADNTNSIGSDTQEAAERIAGYGTMASSTQVITRVAHTTRAHATEVNSVAFNTSGKILFSGSSDGTVRAWDARNCTPLGEYRGVGTAHPLLCVRGSVDGAFVLGTGCDRKCFVWRVATGRVYQTLVGHKGKVLAAAFGTGASELITGSSDRSLRVWDITRGRSVQTISCQSSCNDLALADGGQFASAHHDSTVRIWDARTKRSVFELRDIHSDQVTSVSFSASGNELLTNSRDHTLRVIDARTFGVVTTLSHADYHCGFDWSKASLSPDGAFAAAGSADGTVFVWCARTGKVVRELRGGHAGAVACCVWRPSGDGVATCDKNGFLVLWE